MKTCGPKCPTWTSWGEVAPGKGQCHWKCDDSHERVTDDGTHYGTCVSVTDGMKCFRKEPDPSLFDDHDIRSAEAEFKERCE